MTKDEALRMAIDGLEIHQQDILDACKEALEQPKEWQGMSDDEISECLSKTKWNDIDHCPDHDVFASHIEQALKEKNNG